MFDQDELHDLCTETEKGTNYSNSITKNVLCPQGKV